MGSLPYGLAESLRDRLGLERAVETGTYEGGSARALAGMFPRAVSMELSPELYERARATLADVQNLDLVNGDSRTELRPVAAERVPTLYWLDAHWSKGATAGEENPCPVLEELQAIGPGHPSDCILIDDAREFATTRDPERWPTLVEVLDEIRRQRPDSHVTVIHDLIVSVPQSAKEVVDDFGHAHIWDVWEAGERARGADPHKRPSLLQRTRARAGQLLGRG